MNLRLSFIALGLVTFVGCADEGQISDAAIDGGRASNAAIDGALGCMEADNAYFSALVSDPILRQLGACTRDEDCALWRPDLVCPAIGLHALSCGAGTRADRVDASYARRDEIASTLCPRIEPSCRIGALCAPLPAVRCQGGTCTTRAAVDGGRSDGGSEGGSDDGG